MKRFVAYLLSLFLVALVTVAAYADLEMSDKQITSLDESISGENALCGLCFNGFTLRYCGRNKAVVQSMTHEYSPGKFCYAEHRVSYSFARCDNCYKQSDYWFSHSCEEYHSHCGRGAWNVCMFGQRQ